MANSLSDGTVHAGHRQRVKQNAAENGFTQLEDHKLLELLLFYSIPRADTNELAHKLIDEFGSLGAVFKAPFSELSKVDGVGESTALLIASIGEVNVRSFKECAVKKTAYKSKEEITELAKSFYINEHTEKAVVLCFDSVHRLKKSFVISQGDSVSTDLDLRKIVKNVIDCSAVSAMLVHNHPEGEAVPSAADIDTTRAVSVMLRKIGVVLADHIIIGSDLKAYSMFSDATYTQLFY